jgi:hypothetical protein
MIFDFREYSAKVWETASSLSERQDFSAGEIDGRLTLLESLKRVDSRECE